jgi:flagellar motor switch protein FliN/FliY
MAGDKPRNDSTRGEAGSAEQIAVQALESAAQAAQTLSAEAAASRRTGGASAQGGGASRPVDLPDFAAADGSPLSSVDLGLLGDVTLRVKIELGRTQMYVEDILRLNANSVVELDKAAGDHGRVAHNVACESRRRIRRSKPRMAA